MEDIRVTSDWKSGMSHINFSCFSSHTSFSVLPTEDPQLSGVSPTFLPAMLSLSALLHPPQPAPHVYRLEVTSLCAFMVVGLFWSPVLFYPQGPA